MDHSSEVQGKLQALRDLHNDWAAEDVETMNEFDQRISELTAIGDYCDLDTSKQILEQAKRMIRGINEQLLNEALLDDLKRLAALHAEKRVWKYLVVLYSRDYRKDLNSVEKEIEVFLPAQGKSTENVL